MQLCAGSDAESGALVLIGDVDSFRQLARLLRAGEATTIQVDEVQARTAILPIGALNLERGDGQTTIGISDDTATLTGDAASRARLADEIDVFLEHNDLNEPGMHIHIDAASVSGGELLASGSRDLILAGPVPDDPR
jgi:hypothetical protein